MMLKNLSSTLISAFRTWMYILFGRLIWTMPLWLNTLRAKTAERPRVALAVVGGTFLSIFAILFGYHWYTTRPQPEHITAKISVPAITPVDKILIPDVLTINFGIQSEEDFIARSVAPLNLIGKEVTKDITITPKVAGKWVWQTDSQLIFTPVLDWPAGKTYTVAFAEDALSKGIDLDPWSYSFTTKPFVASIDNFRLYVEPLNPRIRQAVATIHFNYPVDDSTLENKIAVQWQSLHRGDEGADSAPLKFTIQYDENRRTAYLRTDNIPLPKIERYLMLTLADGIKPKAGVTGTQASVQNKILIPASTQYFKVKDLATTIVRNQKNRPERVLTVETSLGLSQSELDQSIHAYVLPKDYPPTATEQVKPNYRWTNPGEITPAILAASTKLNLTTIPADRDYATLHSYRYDATTPASIYISIDKGMRGFGDFTLANSYQAVLSAPEYPKEISFMHKGALLPLGTEVKLSVLVRGVPAVKFNISRVLAEDVTHLVTQTSGDFSNPYFNNYSFNQDNISEIFTSVQQFDSSDLAKQQYTSIDLRKYLGDKTNQKESFGLFLLEAQGWDLKTKTSLGVQDKRLILVTDLGIIVKDHQDGAHDVFIQSITQGKPVQDIDVSILGKNGVPIYTRKTDAQGRAQFPSLENFTNEREPAVFIARQHNDVAFIPYHRLDRKLNFSKYDVGGLYTSSEGEGALIAYVFSDRGIYRPGDIAHIGMIIKQPYVLPVPAGLPLEAIVIDPRGTIAKTEKMTLNNSGYIAFDFQTNTSSPTGSYHVNLYIVKDQYRNNLIGSTTLMVDEFLPDRMKITSKLSENKKGWISPEKLSEKVELWNLYGKPAVGHRVMAKTLLSPTAVSFPEYPDYTFLDPLRAQNAEPKVFTETLRDARTNDQGQVEFDLNLDKYEKATYQLTVFTEGFEAEGGRSVTTQSKALVSPLEYLLGYKSDGDLGYIKQDSARSVHFIAINAQLQQQPLDHLKLQLSSLHPVTSLVKNSDGTYAYKSIVQSTQLSSRTFALTEQGGDYVLPTSDIGEYRVVIVDQNDTELSRFQYSVTGAGHLVLPKNADLTVKLNKVEFAPNEDIEMQINAPYIGSGLITIERDRVYATQWFTTDTTHSIQKIHIPADFKGDGYVNIAFVRDLNSPEIFMSPLSYSVVPFSVTHKNQTLNVDLAIPKIALPGETLPIHYKTDQPGKIIIFAVDEGILQVTDYASPDPLKFFFQKHALEVGTSQVVDQILPKFLADRELSSVGGDDGEAVLKMHLNPFKRKTESPVVYWSGIIDTDITDHQVSYQVPDYFNGTLRVMAVAVASDAVGSATQSSTIRGHFVISPNVPTFVAPGDEFVVTASIANNVRASGRHANVNVKLTTTPQLLIIGSPKISMVIPEGEERSVHFKVHAHAVLGSADLKFVATFANQSASIVSTTSVRPAVAYHTTITGGSSSDRTKSLPLDRKLYPEYRNVEAVASSSPTILVTGIKRFLDAYPYGCTEQLVSKALPWLMMSKQAWFTENLQATQEKIDKTIQLLSQRQMSTGGFSYWPEAGVSWNSELSSVYAMNFLLEARSQGYNVDSSVYSSGIAYLRELATKEVTSLKQARLTAYAIYLLTRNEIVTTNVLTNLQLTLAAQKDYDWKNDITSAYIAATYQILKSQDEANKLIAYYKPLKIHHDDDEDFYDSSIGDAQYLYLISRHFPDRLQSLDAKILKSLIAALNEGSISTISSGYTVLALSAYGRNSLIQDGQLSVSETLKDGVVHELSEEKSIYHKVNITPAAQQVDFKNPSRREYFYQLVQQGFDSEVPNRAVSNGIEVFREYTHADGSPINNVNLGDEIVVHIRRRAIDNKSHTNIALTDLLPGGFEVVPSSVGSPDIDYADVREDRVIFFVNVGVTSQEVTYRIKATNVGRFVVPPVAGVSMYDPMVRSVGVGGEIRVS